MKALVLALLGPSGCVSGRLVGRSRLVLLVAAVGLALGLAAGRASANDAALTGIGGTVRPVDSHPSVRLVSEEVRIKLPERLVEARFVFRNEGPATSVLMGFPEEGWGDIPSVAKFHTQFRDFRSWVDGKPVKVTRTVPKPQDDLHYRIWWTKRVSFAKGQTRVVTNRYRGGRTDSIEGMRFFVYILTTGASWKGPIGHTRVVCNLRGLKGYYPVRIKPGGYKRKGDALIWDFRDFEPKENIRIDWFPGFLNVRVNEDPVSNGGWFLAQGATWGRTYPFLRGRVAWASARAASAWLGAKLTMRKRNRVVRLTRGDRWADVTVGSRWIETPGGRMAMPALAAIKGGHVVAALGPLTRALGGQAHFDTGEKRLDLWVK